MQAQHTFTGKLSQKCSSFPRAANGQCHSSGCSRFPEFPGQRAWKVNWVFFTLHEHSDRYGFELLQSHADVVIILQVQVWSAWVKITQPVTELTYRPLGVSKCAYLMFYNKQCLTSNPTLPGFNKLHLLQDLVTPGANVLSLCPGFSFGCIFSLPSFWKGKFQLQPHTLLPAELKAHRFGPPAQVFQRALPSTGQWWHYLRAWHRCKARGTPCSTEI